MPRLDLCRQAGITVDTHSVHERLERRWKLLLSSTLLVCSIMFLATPREGEEGVRGLGGWYLYEIALWLHAGSLLRHAFRKRLKFHLLQSNRHGFKID